MMKSEMLVGLVIPIFVVCFHVATGTTPGDNTSPPRFVDDLPQNNSIEGLTGKNVRLLCKAVGQPSSFIKWHKGEESLASSKRIRIYKNYLMIKKLRPDDAGQYHCAAINPFGRIERNFQVTVFEEEAREIQRAGNPGRNADDFDSLKKQIEALKERIDRVSENNIHLHVGGEEQGHELQHKPNGKHIFLNILMNGKKASYQEQEELHGHCEMVSNKNYEGAGDIKGNIHIVQQTNGSVVVDIHLSGFQMAENDHSLRHGFPVHEFGDMRDGCESLGNIYNHQRHRSNHKTITCDDNGEVHTRYTDSSFSLHGENSVFGRSFVIHDHREGKRIACCVIVRTEPSDHEKTDSEMIHFTEQLMDIDKNQMVELNRRGKEASFYKL